MFNRKRIKELQDKIEYLQHLLNFTNKKYTELCITNWQLLHNEFNKLDNKHRSLAQEKAYTEALNSDLRHENHKFIDEFKISPWWKM